MALELISHPICPYVHRAAALLTAIDVPFTARTIDLRAKPDWFVAISPRGKVPVLLVDGAPIFESNVILEYLAERFAPQLVPNDPLDRARQRMWIELTNDLMTGHYRIAVAGSHADRAAAIAASRDTLARFEQIVVGPWFGGEQPNLVDFAAGPALLRFGKLDAWLGLDLFAGLAKVGAWARRVSESPAFTRPLVADFDDRLHALVTDLHAAA